MTNLRAFLLATVAAIGALAITAGAASAACTLPNSPDASLTGGVTTSASGVFTESQKGSYVQIPFDVPVGTTGMRVQYCYETGNSTTLDMGVYEPAPGGGAPGMAQSRGWSGSAVKEIGIANNGFTDTATYNNVPSGPGETRKDYVTGHTTRAYEPGAMPAGEWTAELGLGWIPPASTDPDGIAWQVEVTTTTDSSWSNDDYVPDPYVPNVANPAAGWYDGDLHVHGEEEPGNAPMEQTFDKGFGAGPTGNDLDFMTLVDHNNMVARGEIGRYDQNHPGKLIIQGTEVTTYNGHWNSQNAGQLADFRAGPVLRFDDADADDQVEAGELDQVRASLDPSTEFAASSASGGWAQINHPTIFNNAPQVCRGCAWAYSDTQTDFSKVDAIEVSTGPAVLPNNQVIPAVTANPYLASAIAYYEHALSTGAHIAAVASSDDHQGGDRDQPANATDSQVGRGATAVYADELSQAGVTAAVKAGHTYAKPFGADAPDVTMTASAPGKADAIPGDSITAPSATIAVNVKNGAAAAARPGSYLLEILKDGISVDSIAITSDDFNHQYTATETGRYSFEVSRTPGTAKLVEAYSSPVWFTRETVAGTAKIRKVSVSGPAKVKKGKKATYKVKVTNSGTATANGVKLKVSGRGVSAKSTVGKVAAGKSKVVKVRLKPKKPGKVKLTFKVSSSNAGGKTVKKTIKVRK